jgi:hypothetical protein
LFVVGMIEIGLCVERKTRNLYTVIYLRQKQ